MQTGRRTAVLFILIAALSACGGCSMFRNDHDAEYAYERTRRQLSGEPLSESAAESAEESEERDSTWIVAKDIKGWLGKDHDPKLARQLYTEADEQYRQAIATEGSDRKGLFAAAAMKYQDAANRWSDSALEEDALYMVGEGYFFADRYPKSNLAYEKLLKKYPNSRHLDTVEARRFSIAQYWLELHSKDPQSSLAINWTDKTRSWRDTFGSAVRVFDRIRIDDPTGKLADDATMAAANAHFNAGNFLSADDFYTDLRKTFPSSEHQFKAHLLGLESKLRTYRGPEYDGKSLGGAEELIKQIRKQFPVEAESERDYLARSFATVRYSNAEREFRMGQYYDQRTEYGGARYYYNIVSKDYDDTPFAEQARERVVALGGKPDVPPQKLEWLVNLFPESEDVKPLIATTDLDTNRR